MADRKRRKITIGDIYAIQLPNGKIAFGRTFKDGCIAIYRHLADIIDDLPDNEDYQFTVGVYQDVLISGEWKVVDERPFHDVEEQWPPPMCIIDSISGEYSIYFKGEIRASSEAECEGLEVAAVWEAGHIVDRILGENKWHKR